jgi:hypothetical protein
MCGQSVRRCGLEEAGDRRSLEIPTRMFEPAACGRLRLTSVPIVGCDALLELKAVLRAAQRGDRDGVLQVRISADHERRFRSNVTTDSGHGEHGFR